MFKKPDEQARLYFRLSLKKMKIPQNICFNEECVEKKLIPRFIHVFSRKNFVTSQKVLQRAKEY